MAYSNDTLSIGGNPGQIQTNSPRIWSYGTDDTLAVVRGAGYFNDAASKLAVGDFILIRSSIATTAVYSLNVVLSISDVGVVDVSNGLAIPTTNS